MIAEVRDRIVEFEEIRDVEHSVDFAYVYEVGKKAVVLLWELISSTFLDIEGNVFCDKDGNPFMGKD